MYAYITKFLQGDWVLLGSLCYPESSGEDVITVETKGLVPDQEQKVLMYDDESISFAKALGSASCSDREKLAKKLMSDGRNFISVVYNENRKAKITLDETKKRRWFFVAANCGGDVAVEYKLTSSKAIACQNLFAAEGGGLTVAIIFLGLIIVGLASMTYLFRRKARFVSLAVPTTGTTHYDDL